MYCEPCRRERPTTSRFCVLCGGRLIPRPSAEIEVDLTHVTWLLDEVARWDNTLAPTGLRRVLREFYSHQLTLLSQALAAAKAAPELTQAATPMVEAPATSRPVDVPRAFPAAAQLPADAVPALATTELPQPFPAAAQLPADAVPALAATELPADAVGAAGRSAPEAGAARDLQQPAAPPSARVLVRRPAIARAPSGPPVPPRPSAWDRLWKPIIGESLGWFIGAFLILAGTFAYVAGEWTSMSEVSRALTVFGVMVFWSLGFAGWARLLSRKEATRPASTILWRISAAVAPLATVALGPIVVSGVLLAWPLMLAQAAVAALLARKVALDAWQKEVGDRGATEAGVLALASAFATCVLGAAPMLAFTSAPWLELAPIALAMVAWRHGPVDTGRLTRFSLATLGYVLGLIAIRLHVAVTAAELDAPWGIHAVALSAFCAAALELRQRTPRAADGLRIVVVAVQALVLAPAFFAPAPAFVLAALLATITTARLAQRSGAIEATAARWLVPAYAFGYVAFQRSYQLVPPIVMDWFQQLKSWLGYASAPMPASYVSIYAAIYVVGVGLFAGVALHRASSEGAKARAALLLSCTTWGALFFAAVAMLSLETDARPALVAVPLLFATTLSLGAWHQRLDLTRAAAVLGVASGVTFAATWHEAWPVALLALGLAAVSIISSKRAREAYSASSMLLVAFALGLSFIGAAHLSQALAITLAAAAAILIARNLDDPGLLSIACATPLLLELRFGTPLILAASALVLVAALPRKGERTSRLGALWLASFVAAMGAPVWQVLLRPELPTFTLALGAASLILGAHRMRRADPSAKPLSLFTEAIGLVFVFAALLPFSKELASYAPWHAQLIAGGLALGASIVAVRNGRSWQGVVLASEAILLAFVCCWPSMPWEQAAGVLSVTALLATPALLASITVPIATVAWLVPLADHPRWLVPLAVVLSLLALLEETDFTWSRLLNRSRVGWAASLSAAVTIALAIAAGVDPWWITIAMVALPLAWTRATRERAMLALGVALAAAPALLPLGRGQEAAALLAPLTALLFSRVVLGVEAIASRLGVKAEPSPWLLLVSALAAWTSAVTRAPQELSALWFAALLVLGGEALALNLVAAALVAAWVPALQLPGAAVLLLVAIALHHLPSPAKALLGATRTERAIGAAVLSSAAVALVACVTVGGVPAQVMLGASLLVAGVLLGQWPLASLAVLLAGVDLHGSLVHQVVQFTPFALPVAAGAALLAIASRFEVVEDRSRDLWRLLGEEPQGPSSNAWWWGAMGLLMASLVSAQPAWLLVAALLLLTPDPLEAAVAIVIGAMAVLIVVPREQAAMYLGAAGAALAWLAVLKVSERPVARTWLHAGWVLALMSVVVAGGDLHQAALPIVWGLAALTAWAMARHTSALEWGGWAATWLASHVLVAYVGLRLSTGQPVELVIPWLGLASAVIALVALFISSDGTAQRRYAGLVLGWTSMIELFAGMSLLYTAHEREALVALAAGALVLLGAGRRAIRFDDSASAWLGQTVVVVTVMAIRRLGAGVAPGVFEAWAAMTWGPVLFGLALFLGREQRPQVAAALRSGAILWPLVGLVAAPWGTPGELVLLLLVQAGHYAWVARAGSRRVGAGLSAIAFNGAMVAAFFATSWHGVQDLALPAGLSILALTYAFRDDLGRDTQVRLRAVAMTAVYAAAAWRPLTFTTTAGLLFCVLVCVAGVAAGAFLRIRSYVLLGTAFLVTSVVATLIRQGLAEPRLGAVLLAAVGLGIVAFMVLFTTRRAELQERMSALQSMLSSWDR